MPSVVTVRASELTVWWLFLCSRPGLQEAAQEEEAEAQARMGEMAGWMQKIEHSVERLAATMVLMEGRLHFLEEVSPPPAPPPPLHGGGERQTRDPCPALIEKASER